MEQKDTGYEFEEVIIKFFGSPTTSIYFASYFDRNNKFPGKALLFSICVREINIFSNKYSSKKIKKCVTIQVVR